MARQQPESVLTILCSFYTTHLVVLGVTRYSPQMVEDKSGEQIIRKSGNFDGTCLFGNNAEYTKCASIFWMMVTFAWWCPYWKELTEPLRVNNHTEASIISARCVKQILGTIFGQTFECAPF